MQRERRDLQSQQEEENGEKIPPGLSPISIEGSPECPCLRADQLEGNLTEEQLGYQIRDLSTYGIGCKYHDFNEPNVCAHACENFEDTEERLGILCQEAWCRYAFCWVDPNDCDLDHKFFNNERVYSYATCGFPDVYTHDYGNFAGTTLKIGIVNNRNGWKGAFHKNQSTMNIVLDDWSGPTVDFFRGVQALSNITLEATPMPLFLKQRAHQFFHSKHHHSHIITELQFCTYLASLGFVDLCVSEFIMTAELATLTSWFVMNHEPLHLIRLEGLPLDLEGAQSFFEGFIDNITTIFSPLELRTWLFSIFVVLPIMAALFVVHDRGRPGTAFPKTTTLLEIDMDEPNAKPEYVEREIPWFHHFVKSLYVNILSLFLVRFDHPVVSAGGMLHLLGFSFFVMTFLAVYTANLAAILTQQNVPTTVVKSLQAALDSNYTLCIDRRNIVALSILDARIPLDRFVKDPDDGQPGFNCCNPRRRVFDFLDDTRAFAGDKRYCHAAIVPLEDLEAVHGNGLHCNKSSTGEVVGHIDTGFPIVETKNRDLSAIFIRVRSGKDQLASLQQNRPSSKCKAAQIHTDQSPETASLGFRPLVGIWAVSFGFALVGLCVQFVLVPYLGRRYQRRKVLDVVEYDQSGNRIDCLHRGDEWIHELGKVDRHGHLLVTDRFDLDKSAHGSHHSRTNRQTAYPSRLMSYFGSMVGGDKRDELSKADCHEFRQLSEYGNRKYVFSKRSLKERLDHDASFGDSFSTHFSGSLDVIMEDNSSRDRHSSKRRKKKKKKKKSASNTTIDSFSSTASGSLDPSRGS